MAGINVKMIFMGSNRYDIAIISKYTIKEAIKELKKQGIKTNGEILPIAYFLIYGTTPEWHHGGFYTKNGKKRNVKISFFSREEIKCLSENWKKIEDKIPTALAEHNLKYDTLVKGIFFKIDGDIKTLSLFTGKERYIPKNFISLTDTQFKAAIQYHKKQYSIYDEQNLKIDLASIENSLIFASQ